MDVESGFKSGEKCVLVEELVGTKVGDTREEEGILVRLAEGRTLGTSDQKKS